MDLDRFYADLIELYENAGQKTELLEKNAKIGFQGMSELLEKLTAVLPDWFFFFEQTDIGSKGQVLQILQDMEKAIDAEDRVLLADTLLYGLREVAGEYIGIIEEALYGT